MNPISTLDIFVFAVFALGLVAGVLVQTLHPSPWVRKQVENVYGPAYAFGSMFGMFIWALIKHG